MADDDFKVNELILCMGPPSNAILQRCALTADEKRSYEKVTKMFTDHFRGARNIVYELARLHRTVQREGETIGAFIDAVFAQAENCDFDNVKVSAKELLTQSQLIAGMANRELAAQLQMDPYITLAQVVQCMRIDANIASQQAVIRQTSHSTGPIERVGVEVDAVRRQRTRKGTGNRFRKPRYQGSTAQCPKCGHGEHNNMRLCPAIGKTCNSCKKVGHFAKMCRSKWIRAADSVAISNRSQNVPGKLSVVGEKTNFLGKITAQSTGNAALTRRSQP
uniref:CCHC-type domain-containing protein n=1 Tax=Trichuris muris TaxID=70415 RepID=A0A5S6Q622_TRIMR